MGLLSSYLAYVIHNSWLWTVTGVVTLYWAYMRKWNTFYDTSTERTDDKVFLITGAESGIGRMCADLLAARGGTIIMACKDMSLGKVARDEIAARTLNEEVEVRHLDLSCLDSVRKFAAEIHNSVDKLDVLINNNTMECVPNTATSDGLNSIMQVNHFGPFLLTNLLLDLLKNPPQSRILFVSSIVHHFHKFSLDNLNCEKESLPSCRVFCNSKLANILTAKYFARMLRGTGVTVNSIHPGMTRNEQSTKGCSQSVVGVLFNLWLNIFGKTPFEAAMTPTYVATEPKLAYVTGEHFAECKVSNCVTKIAKDRILQDKLFEKSAQLVQLRSEERHI